MTIAKATTARCPTILGASLSVYATILCMDVGIPMIECMYALCVQPSWRASTLRARWCLKGFLNHTSAVAGALASRSARSAASALDGGGRNFGGGAAAAAAPETLAESSPTDGDGESRPDGADGREESQLPKSDARFWSLICERRRLRRFVCAVCTLFETTNWLSSSEVSGGRYI